MIENLPINLFLSSLFARAWALTCGLTPSGDRVELEPIVFAGMFLCAPAISAAPSAERPGPVLERLHTPKMLDWLGFGGASGCGLLAAAAGPPPWVPISCALIAVSPALCDRCAGWLRRRRVERNTLAEVVKLRAEDERLMSLLYPTEPEAPR